MKRYETLETLFRKVDLSFAEKVLREAFHPKDSAGRPQELRQAYKKRVAVERVFSRLKNLVGLKEHNLRGLAKLTFHSQLCIITMLLVAQAAVNAHKNGQSRSIRYFAN